MELDKFYTKPFIAEVVCLRIDFDLYSSVVEPSAGNGSFIPFLPKDKLFAYDLKPELPGIIEQDFFTLEKRFNPPTLFIGNPPFGRRSILAKRFFNKAAEQASTIAFILPLQFRKWSVQNYLDKNFWLEVDETLPDNSFFYEDRTFDIGCCFQIWHNKNFKAITTKDLRIKEKPLIKLSSFEMWQYNNTKQASKYFDNNTYKWDFAVPRQGYYDYTIKEIDPNKMDKKIQWIFFKANNKIALENLLKIDFEKLSKKNTTIPGFGKADVVEEYLKIYGDI